MEQKSFGKIGLVGLIEITVRDKDGNIKDHRKMHNLIVDAGLAGLASRINGSGAEAAFTYLAVGIGTTAVDHEDETLESEIVAVGLERASATCSRTTTTVTNDTAKLSKTWSVTGTRAVTEVGALNASSVGTLLGRQVFAAVNVNDGDSLQIDYSFSSANA